MQNKPLLEYMRVFDIVVIIIGCVNITGETLSGLIERQVTLEQVNIFNCFQFCDGLKYFSLSVSTIF